MAGLGRKVFTAGDVLTASDVQNYLMDQTVMNFAGTAARSSAIATPTTGMTTYIGTTGTATIPQLEVYTGSAFQTPYGSTLVANVSFTSATTITIDNVFTSAYTNYLIVSNIIAAANTGNSFVFRTGGVDFGSSVYSSQFLEAAITTIAAQRNSSQPNANLTDTGAAQSNFFMNVFSPQVAAVTTYQIDGLYSAVATQCLIQKRIGLVNSTNQFDGIKISCGTALTGNLQIYGYRRS